MGAGRTSGTSSCPICSSCVRWSFFAVYFSCNRQNFLTGCNKRCHVPFIWFIFVGFRGSRWTAVLTSFRNRQRCAGSANTCQRLWLVRRAHTSLQGMRRAVVFDTDFNTGSMRFFFTRWASPLGIPSSSLLFSAYLVNLFWATEVRAWVCVLANVFYMWRDPHCKHLQRNKIVTGSSLFLEWDFGDINYVCLAVHVPKNWRLLLR